MKPTACSNFACLILVSLFCAGCISFKDDRNVYRENGVEIVTQEKTSVLPHGWGDMVLKVAGHSFHNLNSPNYVFIPEWNSIIFLTHREGSAYYILHIFSLNKKLDIAIKQDDLFFGGGLGHPKTSNHTSFVEKVEGDVAILVDRGYGGREITIVDTFQLDRLKKTVSHLKRSEERRVDKPN